MNFEDFRKHYPFIAYGEEYTTWCKRRKWYKWLYNRLHTERPTEKTCHEWRRLHWVYKNALDEYEKSFKALPKPTKEQYSDMDDPNYPWTTGKWPEDATEQIKAFLEEANHCGSVAKDVAAILTEKDYRLNVLHEKTCDSTKDMEKGWKKKK